MKMYTLILLLCLSLSACTGTPTPDLAATQQAVAAATQAAQPTDTPEPRTDTPTPTDTPLPPTDTPTPTDTPLPPTDTPTPTDTPVPLTDTPTPTDTPLPPTDTSTPAATATATATSPPAPTATPTEVSIAASLLDITWSEQMNYEGRVGESRWCQIYVTYTNNSGETYPWPAYRPFFLILNADGSQAYAVPGNYYSKADGWPTGIEGIPPDIPAGTSAEWTWYSATEQAGQYCAMVVIGFQDWIHAAEYDAEGRLVETQVVPAE